MNRDPWRTLLGGEGPDPGCEACFEELDRYAEALLAGRDATRLFPQVFTHLENCAACREDAEGLIAALSAGDDRSAPPR